MPLLESAASADTACVSTAPVFAQEVCGQRDGARKAADPGWWALMEHNGGRDPAARSSWAHSMARALWLAVLVATSACIPAQGHWFAFNAAVIAVEFAGAWLPDQGDSVLPYCSIVVLPIVVFKGAALGGLWTFNILLHVFVLVPAMEWVVGVDVGNQTKAVQRELHREFRFELLTLSVAPGVLGCLLYGAWLANFGGLTWCGTLGLSIGVGVLSGVVGIVAGHELCHKASWYERSLGRLLLCSVGYGHFYIEHTLGHHKYVATDLDPATSLYGESFYHFLPRVVRGEFVSACHIEAARLKRKGLSWWHSEIPLYFLCTVAIACLLACLTGPAALPFFLVQSAVAVLLFESVNYLEHYGLERVETSPGQYEPVHPRHSWDSPARFTNAIMFKLQRHADHHAHAGKRYQTLQAYDASPQLPAGYATMIVLALVPPLWRAVMDPRLHEYRKQQAGQRFRHGPSFPADGGSGAAAPAAAAVAALPKGVDCQEPSASPPSAALRLRRGGA